jgi:hypothetical protein
MTTGTIGDTGITYIKPTPWNGKTLTGIWDITLKIDGARMLRDADGLPVSRAGKPLYNLAHVPKTIVDAEIYRDNWESSMSLVRSSVNGSPVPLEYVYSLHPLDPRLVIGTYENPTPEFLQATMEAYVSRGYEGLILRQGTKELKIKPKETADVRVTGIQPGKGKHEGKLGAFLTDYGKVGTGFSDDQREELNDEVYIGQIIEAGFMERTPAGKMRHPRFLRVRLDKEDESLPWVTEGAE